MKPIGNCNWRNCIETPASIMTRFVCIRKFFRAIADNTAGPASVEPCAGMHAGRYCGCASRDPARPRPRRLSHVYIATETDYQYHTWPPGSAAPANLYEARPRMMHEVILHEVGH